MNQRQTNQHRTNLKLFDQDSHIGSARFQFGLQGDVVLVQIEGVRRLHFPVHLVRILDEVEALMVIAEVLIPFGV